MNLLINLECQITCYDTRQEWLNKLPESKRLVKRCSENLVSEVANIREGDFLLLMTMGHSSDMPVLIEILRSRAAHTTPYIGVIGSDAKAARLRKDVLEAGLGDADTRRFSCPMGLPFGTNDPNEIAVSISAQLLQVRDQLRVKANAERAAGNGGAAQVSETRSGVTTSIEEKISCGAQPSQEAKIEATIEAKTVRESATSGRDLSQPLRND
jgi:xanthine/CO dehydrogenase XdhC/CoxF family maturation factor